MTYLNRNLIHEALQELSDESYQRRVWMASSGPEVSSYTEAVCMLFDDSGLDLRLESGEAFGGSIDSLLKQLGVLLDGVPSNRAPLDIINDERMVDVRKLASRILKSIESI